MTPPQEPGPFDPTGSPDATHLILGNDRGEHSLWPVFLEVPAGWHKIAGPAPYERCEELLETPGGVA